MGLRKMVGISGSAKLHAAADFLINLLAGTEKPSAEVHRLAKESGISSRTLERAKPIVCLKSRLVYHAGGQAWVMSVPEEMKGRVFSTPKPYSHKHLLKPTAIRAISSDWVSVVPEIDNRNKIDIPARASSAVSLRVKVGMYEFEADEKFPADKLVELLRGLAVDDK